MGRKFSNRLLPCWCAKSRVCHWLASADTALSLVGFALASQCHRRFSDALNGCKQIENGFVAPRQAGYFLSPLRGFA